MEEEDDLTTPIDSDALWIDLESRKTSKKWVDKKIKWRDEEVITVLQLIQKHNLLDRNPTDLQLGEILAEPLNNLGFKRTPHQIHLKMKSLRRRYVKCKKAGCTEELLKECPFYDLLDAIYSDKNLLIEDTRDKILQVSDEENDNTEDIWTPVELETMLLLIREMKLSNQITLRVFSPRALRKISEALGGNGYSRSPTEVKTALQSLKTTFLNFKKNYQRGQSTKDCPYYCYLKKMWEQEYVKLPKIPRQKLLKNDEIWSEEETVMLLTSIKDLDIVEEAFQNTDLAAGKILLLLNDSGYTRTKKQIQSKMENLMQNYIEGKRCDEEAEAVRKFPFYFIYEKIFGSYFKSFDFKSFGQPESEEELHRRSSRGSCWSYKETKTLLGLVVELNLSRAFRERMTEGVLQKLIKPMQKRGYNRTLAQVKIKMKNLRMHYIRCIEDGCTDTAMAECPFFNELNEIYKQSQAVYCATPEPKIIVRPREKSNTESNRAEPEHNYVQSDQKKVTKFRKQVIKTRSFLLKNINKEDRTTWEPIETIREVNGIKLDNKEEQEHLEELEIEEEREIDEWDRQEVEQAVGNIDAEDVIKDEKEEDVVGVVIEEVNYTDYVENDEFADPNEVHAEKLHPDFEEEADKFSEELSNHSHKSLVDTKDNVISEFFPPEMATSEINELQDDPPADLKEKSPVKSFEKLPRVILKTGTLEVVPVDNLENSSVKEKQFNEVVSEPPLRKRKISETFSEVQEEKEEDFEYFEEEEEEETSMSTLIFKVIEHEKKMQKQHQEWLERQFQAQREHEKEQRNVLLNELKEIRKAITSVINQEIGTKKNNIV